MAEGKMSKKTITLLICVAVIIITAILCIVLTNNNENNLTYDTENESLTNTTNINFMIYDVPHCDGTQPVRCWIDNNESFMDERYYIKSTFPNSSIILVQYITAVENS